RDSGRHPGQTRSDLKSLNDDRRPGLYRGGNGLGGGLGLSLGRRLRSVQLAGWVIGAGHEQRGARRQKSQESQTQQDRPGATRAQHGCASPNLSLLRRRTRRSDPGLSHKHPPPDKRNSRRPTAQNAFAFDTSPPETPRGRLSSTRILKRTKTNREPLVNIFASLAPG